MRTSVLAGAASMIALGAGQADVVLAQVPAAVAPVAVAAAAPMTGTAFFELAQSLTLFEIQASQLALQVSQNPAIRTYAETAISERMQLQSDLVDAAQRSGVAMPPEKLLPQHEQMLTQLKALPPGQFDAVYREFQLSAHKEAVALFRGYATNGDTPIIRETADRWWPCIGAHQEVLPMVHTGERG